MYSQTSDARTSAITASPQRLGRPLMTAIDCIACIGCSPNSRPHWIATRMLAGLSTKSFGTRSDFARVDENLMASSIVRGTRLRVCGRTAARSFICVLFEGIDELLND